ncbi:MAG TPA: NUDIX hydrolase [Opitutaceae bacterium]|nr:NUDIX hydrolase [Opitutaceae bacterium]
MNPASPERRRKLSESVVAATRILEVRHVRYRHEGRDQERDYVVIAAPDWVNVVALTPRGTIVLVRQFRYGIDDFSLEIPGGVIESGEDPVAAGVRELREETGYAGARARLLATVRPNPAIQSNRCHFVLVEDAELQGPVDWDHDEEIEVSDAPVEEVLAWAREGKIAHSLVVAALFHFEGFWRRERGLT